MRTRIAAGVRFFFFGGAAKRPVFSFRLLVRELPLYVLPDGSFVRTASSVSAGMDTSTFFPARRC